MKKWNILNTYPTSGDILSALLKNRNITDPAAIEEFLHPLSLQEYKDKMPEEFKQNLFKASGLIHTYVKNNHPIVIYGDYDCDGVCATAILFKALTDVLKCTNCSYFIPNRFAHGYGVSTKSLDEIHASRNQDTPCLLITVDTGITAVEEVEYAKSLGFEVIVTDHHQKAQTVPEADVVLWSDAVVGGGVAWLLSTFLGLEDVACIDLCALATVTDLQPLVGINRAIVIHGLAKLNSVTNYGIKSLLDLAGKSGNIGVYELGWVIGPRINALGRMEHAIRGVELLTTNDPVKALELASVLQSTNVIRQDETEKMYDIANISDKTGNIIISADSNYHEGIIGLVAARLVQKFFKPAIVISHDETIGKGSVRSVPGIDIISVLRKFDHLFEKLGGHPMAAGFSIKTENIPTLVRELGEYMKASFSDDYFVPFIDIDMEIPLSLVNLELYEKIAQLLPYGVGNTEPVFCSRNLTVSDFSYVGKEAKHLSLKLLAGRVVYKAIFFNAVQDNYDLSQGQGISVAYTISKNVYKDNVSIDLILKDIVLE